MSEFKKKVEEDEEEEENEEEEEQDEENVLKKFYEGKFDGNEGAYKLPYTHSFHHNHNDQ